jgi:hypothetical protein
MAPSARRTPEELHEVSRVPKTIGAALAQHLAGEATTLATCWKITRRDGVVRGIATVGDGHRAQR